MSLKQYQAEVFRTMVHDQPRNEALANFAMGLAGEVGEVLEPLKKYMFHGRSLDLGALRKEFGDVMWYLTALANTLGLSLDEALDENIAKLRERYPDGFKKAAS